MKTVEPTRQAASGGCRASECADRLWAAAVTSPAVLIVGAILDENAVTAGGGLSDAAATLPGTVAGRRGGASLSSFATASPTPVQIGGAEGSASRPSMGSGVIRARIVTDRDNDASVPARSVGIAKAAREPAAVRCRD